MCGEENTDKEAFKRGTIMYTKVPSLAGFFPLDLMLSRHHYYLHLLKKLLNRKDLGSELLDWQKVKKANLALIE